MEQHPLTDFFDQKVQKTTGKNNRTIYKMNNETGEGIITQYIILPGIQFFYNDFHMSNGQNQNKLPHADVLELNHCREGRFEYGFSLFKMSTQRVGILNYNPPASRVVTIVIRKNHLSVL